MQPVRNAPPAARRAHSRREDFSRGHNRQRRGQEKLLHQRAGGLPVRPAQYHRSADTQDFFAVCAAQFGGEETRLNMGLFSPSQGVAGNRRPSAPQGQRGQSSPNRRRKRYNRPDSRQRRGAGQTKSRRQKRRPSQRKRNPAARREAEMRNQIEA